MKIGFLCGSLEQGRDGVGDYTRRLAIELIKKGHTVQVVALNDMHCLEVYEGFQSSEDINLPVIRIPSALALKQRLQIAKEWIGNFNPQWISLQFVIFSFHPRGLPFGLNKLLKNLGKEKHCHIMFHELWVGMQKNASRKFILWGFLQRYLIHSLILNLKPLVIHTQSTLYKKQLERIGCKVELLTLFSNIPVVFQSNNSDIRLKGRKKEISLVLFGTIHPHALVNEFVKEVVEFENRNKIKASIILVGNSGNEKERWSLVCQASGIAIKILGKQPADLISQILGSAAIGVSTSALAMIEKSGTVAAMLEHRLPVLCVARAWIPRGIELPEPPLGIFEFKKGCLEACLNYSPQDNNFRSVSTISTALIARLEKALLSLTCTVCFFSIFSLIN